MGVERLFLAVPLPAETRSAVRRRLVGVPLPGRPVPPENWHLTLRFLGAADAAGRRGIEQAMARAELGPRFEVRIAGLGAFPRPRRAAVLWAGVLDPASGLARLAGAAESAARHAGCPPETRSFAAHLTLARLPQPADVAPLLQHPPELDITCPVEGVVLLRSHLGAGPARYEAVASWPLT